jgi:putative endonuclease
VARRFKASGGEIDLIARRGATLVFVEVKKRANADDAIFAVGTRNRRRLEDAGRVFLTRRPALATFAVRYDIAAVAGLSVRIVKDAWRDPS